MLGLGLRDFFDGRGLRVHTLHPKATEGAPWNNAHGLFVHDYKMQGSDLPNHHALVHANC